MRVFIFRNLDMPQAPSKWPVKHAVQQLVSQEAVTVFGEKHDDPTVRGRITLHHLDQRMREASLSKSPLSVEEHKHTPARLVLPC